MSHDIPLELQEEIMRRLPVKSLIQFRSVSKTWKHLIESADFIKNYGGQQHHLLVRYEDTLDLQEKCVSIADDNTFPQQKLILPIPQSLNILNNPRIIGSSHGLLCFYSDYQQGCDCSFLRTARAVLWNPSIQKAITVDVPNVTYRQIYETVVGFGVCRQTLDPKILKISKWGHWKSATRLPWQIEVFTLSTRAWRSPLSNLPRKSIKFNYYNSVDTDGVLYCLAIDMDYGIKSCNLIISFDMTSEEFEEVNLPHSLAHKPVYDLSTFKRKESLVVVERCLEANKPGFNVWMLKDGVEKSFTKLFAITIPDAFEFRVMGVRKTGEPILYDGPAHPEWNGSPVVYEPYSKSISALGINGVVFSYVGSFYMETLLLS